jgi:hypothetical protein
MRPGGYLQTQNGAHRKPDRGLDVSRIRRPTRELQQGRQGFDDHLAWPPYGRSAFHLCALPRNPGGFVVWGTASGAPSDPTGSATCARLRSRTYRSAPRRYRCGPASCLLKSATRPGRMSCWHKRPRLRSSRKERAGRSRWHSSNKPRLHPGVPKIDYGITIVNTRGCSPGGA